ncbi:hypothetical protein [Sulfitobacter pacificus]|nr:hypothetical protein [Sulfitobacter pacificus]
MARLDISETPKTPAPKPETPAQASTPKPSPKPVFTDYASL